MQPWERRLRDLSHLLKSCGEAYFSPDPFRRSTNQFLQTSRTVTFLIQKNKAHIARFDDWYAEHVLSRWRNDPVMTWAKDARNTIEKEGDLELHSSLRATVLFSHIQAQDFVLSTSREHMVRSDLVKLLKLAKRQLPPAVADGAILIAERRWVANSLPQQELVQALTYVYGRLHDACIALARHTSTPMDKSVPHPTDLDPISNDVGQMRVLKLGERGMGRLRTSRVHKDPSFAPPPTLVGIRNQLLELGTPKNISEAVERHALISKATFEHYGNHIPMMFLFNEAWETIDAISTAFADQSDKYLFARVMAKRAAYLRAYAVIWISESWTRDMAEHHNRPVRDLPIIGERLNVSGADADGGNAVISWEIQRSSGTSRPTLEQSAQEVDIQHFFLAPIVDAMRASRGRQK